MADDPAPNEDERKRVQARDRQRRYRERNRGDATPAADRTGAQVVGGERGNILVPGYAERHVKTYTVFDSELSTLTVLDGIAGLALSLSFAAGSFFFGANWDLLLTAKLPAPVIAEAQASRGTAAWLAVVFMLIAVGAVIWRVMTANHIRKSSTPHVFRSHTEVRPTASRDAD